MGRVLAQAVMIAGVANLLTKGLGRVDAAWLGVMLEALSIGWWMPFSAAVAIGMNNAKAAAVPLLVLTLLVGSPHDLQECARWLSPLGAGLLAGQSCRQAIKEQTYERRSTPES